MKRYFFPLILVLCAAPAFAQKVDSLYFNLYTDSLKKGQHNYINVDGKFSNGRWLPLTTKDVEFSCATAKFEGNQLIIPENFKDEKVVVKATLKSDPTVKIERTIWIKKKPDPMLPTNDEILNNSNRKRRN